MRAVLDTDIVTFIWSYKHPMVQLNASRYLVQYGHLKQQGQLIGEVDILIASIALSEGLAVASRNTDHFRRIAGLTVIDWTK